MAFQAINKHSPFSSAKLFLQKRSGGIEENQYPLSLVAFTPSTNNWVLVVAVAVGMAVGRVALVAATG